MLNRPTRINTGFTLVELLIVMSIIMILVAVALPAANTARQKAKNTEVLSGMNQIQAALEKHAVDHGGFYPGAQWVQDSAGQYTVGPGVIGGVPTYFDGRPNQDFSVPQSGDSRIPYLPDGTPNVQVLDALVVNSYLPDYPANPFLRASDAGRAQMSNLFLFNPILGVSAPDPANPDTLDFDRYTTTETGSMRQEYGDLARGHFSYVPLNPRNLTGIDYEGQWGNLSPAELSEYYKNVRGYMLVGWGHSRSNDAAAKGMSEKYWNSSAAGFDFDNSMDVDRMEQVLSDVNPTGIVYPEMLDSAGSVGNYGGALISTGAPNIDPAFNGAVQIFLGGS